MVAVTAAYLLPIVCGTLLLRLPPFLAGTHATDPLAIPPAGPLHFSQAFLTAVGAVTGAGLDGHGLARLSPLGLGLVTLMAALGALITIAWSTLLMFRWITPVRTERPLAWRRCLGLATAYLLVLQGVGALLLLATWEPELPTWPRIGWAIFHAVSATTSTGFNLVAESPGTIRQTTATPLIVGPLVFLGGLGLPVLMALRHGIAGRCRRTHAVPGHRLDPMLSPHIAAACGGSMALFLIATLLLCFDQLAEAAKDPLRAVADGGVVALTIRSAGVTATGDVNFGGLGLGTLLLLALAGTCPGSAGGGMKLTNVMLLAIALVGRLRRVRIIGPPPGMLIAAAMVCLVPLVALGATLPLLLWIEPITPRAALCESVRAVTLAGLPLSMASQLTPPGKAVIIAAMLVGRVGPILLLACTTTRCVPTSRPPWHGPLPGP